MSMIICRCAQCWQGSSHSGQEDGLGPKVFKTFKGIGQQKTRHHVRGLECCP